METKRIIEINGVKLEIDLREAKTIDSYKVGDAVKILIKSYGESYKSSHGMIVGFDMFAELPTITVAYLESGYSPEIKYAYINNKSKDIELVKAYYLDEMLLEKETIEQNFLKQIEESKLKTMSIERQFEQFKKMYGKLESAVKKEDLREAAIN